MSLYKYIQKSTQEEITYFYISLLINTERLSVKFVQHILFYEEMKCKDNRSIFQYVHLLLGTNYCKPNSLSLN
jgi:hypothetical protein